MGLTCYQIPRKRPLYSDDLSPRNSLKYKSISILLDTFIIDLLNY